MTGSVRAYIRRQVLPHAPSPTMTSFLRMDSVIGMFECIEMRRDGQEQRSISRQLWTTGGAFNGRPRAVQVANTVQREWKNVTLSTDSVQMEQLRKGTADESGAVERTLEAGR